MPLPESSQAGPGGTRKAPWTSYPAHTLVLIPCSCREKSTGQPVPLPERSQAGQGRSSTGKVDSSLEQCSRFSYEFHFEGLSNFNSSVEGLVRIQDVNPRT